MGDGGTDTSPHLNFLFTSSSVEWAAGIVMTTSEGRGHWRVIGKALFFFLLSGWSCHPSCRKIAGKRAYRSYLSSFSMFGVFFPNYGFHKVIAL